MQRLADEAFQSFLHRALKYLLSLGYLVINEAGNFEGNQGSRDYQEVKCRGPRWN